MSVEVVAALIWEKGRFLICRRPEHKKRGLLWEFPGGKIEPGEDAKTALARELREELDIGVSVGEAFCDVTHEYPDITVHLTLLWTTITEGRPTLLEHSEMRWIRTDEIPQFDFCPADTTILERLTRLTDGLVFADIADHAVCLIPSKKPDGRILYLHEQLHGAFRLRGLLPENTPDLIVIESADWNAELSPWSADKVFRGGSDFAGGAPDYLRLLTDTIMPEAEALLGHPITRRGIAGYSLSGLFALWSTCQTDRFAYAASMSGSLWYDGFTDYLRTHQPTATLGHVYLSLGDREKETKNARMQTVEKTTREAAAILSDYGIETELTMNPGGHFTDVPDRIADGILHFDNTRETT